MPVKDWIRIIRPVNLLLLAATLYAIDGFILQPNFNTYGIRFSLNEFQYFLLVISIVLICAGGYILNDYFDVQIDEVNKPSKVMIGKGIAPNSAFYVYMLLSFGGLAIGTYLSLAVGNWKLVTIYVMAIALLYFYSATFKRYPLIGNMMVALLAGISILMTFIYEPNLYQLARPGDYFIAGICTKFIIALGVIAFTSTMVREIVKDLEDMEGDDRYGAKTMPIAWGINIAKIIAVVFVLLTLLGIGYIFTNIIAAEGIIYGTYIGVMLGFWVAVSVRLFLSRNAKQYHTLSTMIKIGMLIGLLIMPLYSIVEF